jgi:protein-disulfide isomerase
VIDRLSSLATLIAATTIIAAFVSLLWIGRSSTDGPILPSQDAIQDAGGAAAATISLGPTVKGLPSARTAIIEFSDFQCPYCARYATGTHLRLEHEYVDTGKVKYAFRNLPIEEIHPQALGAAIAAECAGIQGRFWQMYDSIFANQAALARSDLLSRGQALGLNQREFGSCLERKAASKISDDQAEAKRLGINSTPTFLIGELQPGDQVRVLKTIRGAHPFDVFKIALDQVEQYIDMRP